MPNRQTYTVLIPFPTGAGHWSSVGQELDLLDVEATALRTAGWDGPWGVEILSVEHRSLPVGEALARAGESARAVLA